LDWFDAGGVNNSVSHLSWLLGHAVRAEYFAKGMIMYTLNCEIAHRLLLNDTIVLHNIEKTWVGIHKTSYSNS